jgi:hypothetical protein
MKRYFIIFGILFSLCLSAQTDTSKKTRLSGLQLTFGTMYSSGFNTMDLSDYQTFIKSDTLLYTDFNYYTKGQNFGSNFLGTFSFRAFADVFGKGKTKKEISVGVILGGELSSQLSYHKSRIEVTDVYFSLVNKDTLLRIKEYNSYYYFGLRRNKLFVPLSLSFTTNKQRWFWFTAGIEVAPGVSFGYEYNGSNSETQQEATVKPHMSESEYYRYYERDTYKYKSVYHNERLKGIGFAFYSSLPVSMNIRCAKRIPFLKHLNFTGNIAPVFVYSSDKYTGTTSGFGVSGSLGLRWNW